MTRVLVPRGSSSASSSNPSRSSSLSGNSSVGRTEQQSVATPQVASAVKEEENQEDVHDQVLVGEDFSGSAENKNLKGDDHLLEGMSSDLNESVSNEIVDGEFTAGDETTNADEFLNGFGELKVLGRGENEGTSSSHTQNLGGNLHPPPPPVPPPKPLSTNSNLRRSPLGSPNSARVASARRAVAWPVVSTRTSPTASRPSSPRSHGESEGYNSADEQSPGFISYDDLERERQFEIDIRRAKGLEVKKMLEDGNCLFRAVADQVYGDSELYDDVRQMCIDYMERNRDHFSQFITEGFVSYCKRKRRDKVYGNNVEIQAMSEMYNRLIHIYSYSTEPINTFQGNYHTDTPPIRLSYHHGNHYNSLVNPRRPTIGAGLGFSSLRGANVDKDQVKAAIKAQQDQQIDNALLAEGQFYSDIELTEKEIERMVMEASRAEYLAHDKLKKQLACGDSSTSGAEPSSSGEKHAKQTSFAASLLISFHECNFWQSETMDCFILMSCWHSR
ncbi:OVARIAN TUMOR DOMAIN-containing deubiquitinating enzyme 6 isoform X2 [Punica granatum]|uniref:OVARIAN TUMOR DOMAIN-containing deubiquitinating enzyme 6 isoform X2 n=1 Tax=Punica granatum TaxID=22663 RepID=A0A6P8CKB5_PUNGR|nr:OVARIAN TUMOR DOMAIN-containing deubiquitinating enzyme 6 isoform X2 [Punica granatum]